MTPQHGRRPWIAFEDVPEGDFVIFGNEQGALRWAVARGWKVRQVDLGRSLLDQLKQPDEQEAE